MEVSEPVRKIEPNPEQVAAAPMNAGFPAGLYVTDDGGQIWSTLQPLDNGPPPGGLEFNGSILDFLSTKLGWTDTFTGDGDDLLQTTDGGHPWTPVTVQITSPSG